MADQPGPWRAAERREQEAAFRDPLNQLCQKPLRYTRAENFRQQLIGPQQAWLLTCLRHPKVPPTNNLAEQGGTRE